VISVANDEIINSFCSNMLSPRLVRVETIPCYAIWLFNFANWIAYLASEPNWFHFDEGILFVEW
jgi:hypothetical protein